MRPNKPGLLDTMALLSNKRHGNVSSNGCGLIFCCTLHGGLCIKSCGSLSSVDEAAYGIQNGTRSRLRCLRTLQMKRRHPKWHAVVPAMPSHIADEEAASKMARGLACDAFAHCIQTCRRSRVAATLSPVAGRLLRIIIFRLRCAVLFALFLLFVCILFLVLSCCCV